MVIIKLQCELGHSFEGWFKDTFEYKRQAKIGMIDCPTCGCNYLLDSNSKSDNLELDSFSAVRHQEIRMISDQFFDYSEAVQQETKEFSEDGISSVSIKLENIEKDKLN